MFFKIFQRYSVLFWNFLIVLIFIFPLSVSAQSLLDMYKSGKVELVEEWRVGGDTTDEDYILTGISDIAADADGNVLVLDRGDKCIKMYDSNGKFLRRIGKEGAGPGEFQSPRYIAVLPDGRIAVYDFSSRRFSLFAGNGEFIQSNRFRHWISGFSIAGDGDYLVMLNLWDLESEKGNQKIIVKSPPDLSVQVKIDSAYIKETITLNKQDGTDRIGISIQVPFMHGLYCLPMASGEIAVVRSEDFSFRIYSPALKLSRTFTPDRQRQTVSSTDMEKFLDGMVFAGPDGRMSEGLPEELRKHVPTPEYKPYFDFATSDSNGNLLFRTYVEEDDIRVWEVFDSKAAYIARLPIPHVHQLSAFHGNYLYTTQSTDDGFPVIVKYSIQ